MKLKFCQINAENLFLLLDQPLPVHFTHLDEQQWQKHSTSVYNNKPLKHLLHITQTIQVIDADIIMLNEVGGSESLKNFNQFFLKDLYTPILIEGNSDRNIDVGFLIKKNAHFYFDLFSHKNKELDLKYDFLHGLDKKIYKFSRDCSELRLFHHDVKKPFLIILLTHLKSPLDPERIDAGGTLRRGSELRACIDIYNQLKTQHPDTGILLAGDFNGQAGRQNTDDEFKPIYQQTDLEDILELAKINQTDRATFIQVKSGLRTEGRQIDYCFLSKNLHSHLNLSETRVFLYQDQYGSPIKKPETLDQKAALPSDHYPLVFMLENLKF